MYLASEMGDEEILSRLNNFKDVSTDNWAENLHIVERSSDFPTVIENHNSNGLTLIDYLEEVDGEYNKIASNIRAIYDALGKGVVVIAIQKKRDSDIARGGEGTLEKSRVYVSIDNLCTVDFNQICAMKIMKFKNWKERNLNYAEIHFKLSSGAEIEPIGDFLYNINASERERYKTVYTAKNPERKKEQMDNWIYYFKTKNETMVGITEETFNDWQKTYSNLNLYEELDDISNTTLKGNSWLKDGKSQWIFQITGKLASKNERMKKDK
jgi:hypothetical protein